MTVERALVMAREDIARDTMTVKDFGLLDVEDGDVHFAAYRRLLAKYHLTHDNQGCVITEASQRAVDAYNAAIEAELERRHGKGFWKRFDRELADLVSATEQAPPSIRNGLHI